MACRTEHYGLPERELETNRVLKHLDELAGKPAYQGEYHPELRNPENQDLDKLTAKLCNLLQSADVRRYSLELQIWWRDHKAADAKRIESEIKSKSDSATKKEALAKLTEHERRLLGLWATTKTLGDASTATKYSKTETKPLCTSAHYKTTGQLASPAQGYW
jgi:hypothetical protein